MSKQVTYLLAACLCAGALFVSCQKEQTSASQQTDQNGVSQTALSQISARGFSTAGVRKVEGGYLQIGDILLEEQDLPDGSSTTPNCVLLKRNSTAPTILLKACRAPLPYW